MIDQIKVVVVNDMCFLIGVDVGMGSVCIVIFDFLGVMLLVVKCDIVLFKEVGQIVEQLSCDIWFVVCQMICEVVKMSGWLFFDVVGIGFDVMCLLVVVGVEGELFVVGLLEDFDCNIVVWMDYWVIGQVECINVLGYDVFKYVGGCILLEMEMLKFLWFKENWFEIFVKVWQFFDLVDYFSWCFIGDFVCFICMFMCKWMYFVYECCWDVDYFCEIGFGIFVNEDFVWIG